METSGDPRHIGLDWSPESLLAFDVAFAKLLWPLAMYRVERRTLLTRVCVDCTQDRESASDV